MINPMCDRQCHHDLPITCEKVGSCCTKLQTKQQRNVTKVQKTTKRTYKTMIGKPKRPACAYNLFFHLERERILQQYANRSCHDKDDNIINANDRIFSIDDIKRAAEYIRCKPKRRHVKTTYGTISFQDLNKQVAASWNVLDINIRMLFQQQAFIEHETYQTKVNDWKLKSNQDNNNDKSSEPSTEPSSMEVNLNLTNVVSVDGDSAYTRLLPQYCHNKDEMNHEYNPIPYEIKSNTSVVSPLEYQNGMGRRISSSSIDDVVSIYNNVHMAQQQHCAWKQQQMMTTARPFFNCSDDIPIILRRLQPQRMVSLDDYDQSLISESNVDYVEYNKTKSSKKQLQFVSSPSIDSNDQNMNLFCDDRRIFMIDCNDDDDDDDNDNNFASDEDDYNDHQLNKIASEIVIDDVDDINYDHMNDYDDTFDSDYYYNDYQLNEISSEIVIDDVDDDLVSFNDYHLGQMSPFSF